MLTTVVGIVAILALLLPGFVVAELAKSGRARAVETDLELTLRALSYALLIHLAFAWWTRSLVVDIPRPAAWVDHLNALLLYAGVVLVAVPIAVGITINRYLQHAEAAGGPLGLRHTLLGGRDARDAWDYLFQRLRRGAWLIVQLKGGDPGSPRFVGGRFGSSSAVGQSPVEHNLYLEEIWTVGRSFPRQLVEPLNPRRGMFIPADEIDSVEVLNPPGTPVESISNGNQER